ncbi:MAG: hypothetical protein IPF94_18370 [Betaproteobacteria bacterium]|jgi:hypothetical protein|nr:hypothetical protein [Betaproteobacteria bacterium]
MMQVTPRAISRLSALALLLGAVALPAAASGSASSASSDGSSASVGSSSTSFETSSDSSSGERKVADGDYRIIEVADAPARAGTVRLKLHAVAGEGATVAKTNEFFLYMPQEAYDQSRLGRGSVITAKARAYGLEFAAGTAKKPFFLVLADEWFRELQTKVVRL